MQAVEHPLTTFVALVSQMLPKPFGSRRVHYLALRELIDEPQRHVDLPHATHGSPDSAQSSSCPSRHRLRYFSRAQREDLSEPPRGNATLMERLDLALNRAGQMLPERADRSLERATQGVCRHHGRMRLSA